VRVEVIIAPFLRDCRSLSLRLDKVVVFIGPVNGGANYSPKFHEYRNHVFGRVVIFMTLREYILDGATLGHQKPAENLVKN